MHDWGAQLREQPALLQWCFLGAGAQHALAPISGGHQILLQYTIKAAELAPGPSISPFSCALQAALRSRAFMKSCSMLLVPCAHSYPLGKRFTAAALKGADLVITGACDQLGLSVELQRETHQGWYEDDCDFEDGVKYLRSMSLLRWEVDPSLNIKAEQRDDVLLLPAALVLQIDLASGDEQV